MKRKKMSLRNRIFIVQLAQIILILALVYLTFIVLIMSDHLKSLSAMEIIQYIEVSIFRILLLGICISAFLSYKIAGSISKPIRDLSRMAEEMSHMEFHGKRVQCNSREIGVLNDKLIEMAEQISSYYEERNAFLQDISHELKTPLMSIHGYAEAVKEEIEDDVDGAMGIIMEESENLTGMVNQLLVLSKRDAFIGKPDCEDINIADEIPYIMKMVEGIAMKNKIGILYRAEVDPLVCHISTDVLRIVLSNILSNSLRYAKERISVVLSQEDGFALLTVTDDGGGISPDQIEHIFQRNYTGKGGMYGLGLHIVQKTLESVAGSVAVGNAAGGCRFIVRIPLAE